MRGEADLSLDLFAGICVRDHDAAVRWYTALFGSEPAFQAHPTESVWELADHRFVYVEGLPERAGHSEVTLFVEDFDERVAGISGRGIEPESRETYEAQRRRPQGGRARAAAAGPG